ncbi:MAG: FliA/WhiG family RNA polymerase sigma factor [Deltaproteobacteria bacterium]|nr:FliA/WhiG family RNA polymerase sigma factor [Deltaproteobacteria bacterium]
MHRALAKYAAASNNSADELLKRYGTLIDRIARRVCFRTGLHSAYDDLWSTGAVGLIEAHARFDASKGASFETFAAHRIRGAMIDELRRLDHLPRRLRARTDEVDKTKKKLADELGREASQEELAEEMEMDLEDLGGLEALREPQVPLESILPTLSFESEVENDLDRGKILAHLTKAVESLPERLQVLVSLHYVEGLSYREIAQIMGVSEPRVCQLHGDAMKRLRSNLVSDDD